MYARIELDLDALSTKLHRIKANYQHARSLGDAERICQFRIQINAITAERDLLIRRLGKGVVAAT